MGSPKNMLAMYLKYHKAGLTPTTAVTSTAISPVKMSIGRKSLINLRSEMIFLQGKPIFYISLPSTPPYWQIIFRFCYPFAFRLFSGFIIPLRNIYEKFICWRLDLPTIYTPILTDNLPILLTMNNSVGAKGKVGHVTSFCLSVVLGFYHI
jgi:hypothetical protein